MPTRRSLLLTSIGLLSLACHVIYSQRAVDVVSRSTVTGTVNGAALTAEVSATFSTVKGGRSRCEFSRLPTGFTPGTLAVLE
jgi:hypothetical protein